MFTEFGGDKLSAGSHTISPEKRRAGMSPGFFCPSLSRNLIPQQRRNPAETQQPLPRLKLR